MQRNTLDTVRFLCSVDATDKLWTTNESATADVAQRRMTEVLIMTFEEKLKDARVNAGFTQAELADKLMVSRAAIAKWESDRGMPDVSNLKAMSEALGVSIDYLLDDGSELDLSITKKPIDLRKYGDEGKFSRIKKIGIKERIVRDEFPDAEIIRLTVTKIKDSKSEHIVDEAIGWFSLLLAGLPLFGTQELGKMAGEIGQQAFLINEANKQYFVVMTDEQMISRALVNRISDKKFEIGDKEFLVVGTVE